jgi:hypothetical protein
MRIEKRQTIAQIVQRLRPDVRLISARVEVTEVCAQERPAKTVKWSYTDAEISSQLGRMFERGFPSLASEFQGETPIFAALNEAIFGLKMKNGRHEKKGPLSAYNRDDGKSVARTYKATIEFEVIEEKKQKDRRRRQ